MAHTIPPAIHNVDEGVQVLPEGDPFLVDRGGYVNNFLIWGIFTASVSLPGLPGVDSDGDERPTFFTPKPAAVHISAFHISTAPTTTTLLFIYKV